MRKKLEKIQSANPKVVLAARKRVLDMVVRVLSKMPSEDRMTLRVDGEEGIITLDEVIEHAKSARDIKVWSGHLK